MKEIFQVGDSLFSAMIAVDVIVANIWMAFLLYGAGIHTRIDAWTEADTSAISELKEKIETYQAQIFRLPDLTDTIKVISVGFGVTALAHIGSDMIAPWIAENAPGLEKFSLTSGFFWLIVLATTFSLGLSFTRARQLEGIGASRYGSLFLYVLVATIGMKMDLLAIFETPGLFWWDSSGCLPCRFTDYYGKDNQGAFLFYGCGQSGQCRRSRIGPNCCVCFPSFPGPGGGSFGCPGVCRRHLWRLVLRHRHAGRRSII
jgi:hypothetical protein